MCRTLASSAANYSWHFRSNKPKKSVQTTILLGNPILAMYVKSVKIIGVIFGSRFFLTEKILLSLYYTFVYPYLSYCSIVFMNLHIS